MKRSNKTNRDSYTEQVHILTQADMNGYNRLFGGRLMEWIDTTAAVVARRHSGHNVTTAAVSQLNFLGPAYANDTIVLCGVIVYAGRTSMDIRVETFVERLDGTRERINTAYLVLVALDEHEKPTPVPGLTPAPEYEDEYKAAAQRRKTR